MTRWLLLPLLVGMPVVACHWLLTPVHQDIAPGQSCGALDTDCGNGLCCGQYEDCGNGANGCFSGMCCYNATDTYTDPELGSAWHSPKWAWEAKGASRPQWKRPAWSMPDARPKIADPATRTYKRVISQSFDPCSSG